MTVRLKQHKGLVKTIAVIAALVLSGWLYRELHPTIIFHTPQESKYLGKIVCTADGDLEKLYIENHLRVVINVLTKVKQQKDNKSAHF